MLVALSKSDSLSIFPPVFKLVETLRKVSKKCVFVDIFSHLELPMFGRALV